MRTIIDSPEARADLRAILDYLNERSPRAAIRLAAALNKTTALLARQPKLGRSRDDLHPGLRSRVVEKKYVVLFDSSPTTLRIVRIFHGAQDIGAAFRDAAGG